MSVVVGAGSLVAAAGPAPAAVPPLVEVAASAETPPVAASGDHADDPAIWVDPAEPSRSLVIGTETQAALEVYDLSGRLLQRLAYSPGPNNVDVHPSFALGGRDVPVVAANGFGIMRFWVLDPATGRLSDASDGAVPTRGTESGVCLYRSRSSGRTYAFTVGGGGVVEQYELFDAGGLIGARLVRGPWNLGSAGEGCAADDELGFLYVSEEDVGIWKP